MRYTDLLPDPPASRDARSRVRWAVNVLNEVRVKKRPPEALAILWQTIIGWTDICPPADVKPYRALAVLVREAEKRLKSK